MFKWAVTTGKCLSLALFMVSVSPLLSRSDPMVIRVPQDFTTIQEAIQHAVPFATIEVDATKGPHRGPIKIDKSLQLKTVNGRVIIVINGPNNDKDVIEVVSDSVQITGFLVMGGVGGKAGIRVRSNNNTITDNVVMEGEGAGILLEQAEKNWIVGNTIRGRGGGIAFIGTNDNTVEGNVLENNGFGVRLVRATKTRIMENTLKDNGETITLMGASDNTIEGNTLKDNGFGIQLIKATMTTITNNTLQSNGPVAIALISANGNTIVGNNLEDHGIGIKAIKSNTNTVEDNTITGNRNVGIRLTKSTGNTIANNTLTDNRISGISLEDSANNVLQGNRTHDNGDFGIELANSNENRLESNTARDNGVGGILVEKSSANNVLKGNHVGGKSNLGIFITDSDGNSLATNVAEGNRVGIRLSNAHESNLDGNQAQNNTHAGFQLENASKNLLTNNVAMNNGNGFQLLDSDDNVLTANRAEREDVGFALDHSDRNTLEMNEVRHNIIGIDVRESDDVVLRANVAENNEIGILVDNSTGAVLDGNKATNNTVANTKLLDLVEGELLVRFKEGVPQERVDKLIRDLNTSIVRFFPLFSIFHLCIVDPETPGECKKKATPDETLKKVEQFNALPEVDKADPNIRFRLAAAQAQPNDEQFRLQWNLRNEGQSHPGGDGKNKRGNAGADIGIVRAWEAGYTDSSDVIVGIIDSGGDLNNKDLVGNLQANLSFDFVEEDEVPEDNIGHGTFIAGIIGAIGNNKLEITGLNWKASTILLKASDNLSFLGELSKGYRSFFGLESNDFIDAMQLAIIMSTGDLQTLDQIQIGDAFKQRIREKIEKVGKINLRVINFSGVIEGLDVTLIADTIKKADEAGILFVTAAGNSNPAVDNDANPVFPCNLEVENIICVGASDDKDQLAGFSHFGAKSVDLLAPGVDIVSLVPQKEAQSDENATLLQSSGCRRLDEFTAVCGGTSFATAHVSGMAALLFAICPEKTAMDIKAIILNNVEKIEELRGKVASGGRLKWPDVLPKGCQSSLGG